MIFRLFKLVISSLVLVGIYVARLCLRALGRSFAPVCVVLYYHSIPGEERRAFAKQMDMALRLATPISLDNLNALRPGLRYTAITFDDTFADAIENAVPELVSRRIPVRFFVTSGALGRPATWWPVESEEHRRWIGTAEQLRSLSSEFVSFGSHTISHPYLSALGESAVRHELGDSKSQLEAALGYPVNTVSFPYGDFSLDIVRICQEVGYSYAFTTVHSFANSCQPSFLIGRFKSDPSDWPVEFSVKVLGGYVWLPYAVAAKKRLRRLASAFFREHSLSESQHRTS